jgi:Acetyltransferase (GNAT) domain
MRSNTALDPMELQVNPPDARETLSCLNACFPGWGDERTFKWAYERSMQNQPAPDYLVIRENGKPIAGSGINYRQVLFPNGASVIGGIMTGSWTLPVARGRGCFTRFVEESIRITRERTGALLLAFVTEDNSSCRQLCRGGAATFPTSYLTLKPEQAPDSWKSGWEEVDSISEKLFQRWMSAREGFVRYGYGSIGDWRSQIVDRCLKTLLLQSEEAFVVLGDRADTYQLHAFMGTDGQSFREILQVVKYYCNRARKKLFLFSTDPALSEFCQTNGFVEKRGYVTAHVTDWTQLGRALQLAVTKTELPHGIVGDPASAWFLGRWQLQSGDRI